MAVRHTCDGCGISTDELGWWYRLERIEGGGFIAPEVTNATVHHFHDFECLIMFGQQLMIQRDALVALRGGKGSWRVQPPQPR